MAKTMRGLALAFLAGVLTGHVAAAEPPSPLAPPSLLLVGIIMPEGGEPKAILEDPATHAEKIYPLGAQVGDAHLTRILKDRVVLTSDGNDVEVRLAGSPSPPPSPVRRPGPPFRPFRPGLLNPGVRLTPGR